jgi:fucose 4-O-acetylase-like acetyltransferase
MSTRLGHLDVAKGFAIIAVVYGHAAILMMGYPIFSQQLGLQSAIVFSFAMPLFFLVSGGLQQLRLSAPNFNARQYLSRIAQSLLLPFYALGFLFMAANAVLGSKVNAPSVRQMLEALFLQQSNGDMLPSVVLWFLFVLFLFHVFTFLQVKVFRGSIWILILLAFLLRTPLNIFDKVVYFGFDKISDYFLFYLLGYAYYPRLVAAPIARPVALVVFALTYTVVFAIDTTAPTGALAAILRPFGIAELALTLLVMALSFRAAKRFSGTSVVEILSFFGSYSILLYVFHMPVMTVFKLIAVRLAVPPNYMFLVFLFIPGVLVPLLIGRVLAVHKGLYKTLLGRNP